MDDFVTRKEYEEHNRRMEDEHKRTNRRLDEIETANKDNNKLLLSVEKIALSTENLQKEQQEQRKLLESQGKEIDELKSVDGKKWRDVSKYVITALIGLVLGYIAKVLGL